ncbi:MAG: dihydropteridine reductase [Clostridia bacterium]|nr:dihydropteridine reductase [Clostridia bacterium]
MTNSEAKYVQRVRQSYEKREQSNIERLRELDSRVKRGANIFAYIFGIIGSLVLGSGMCLAMDVIEQLKGHMAIGIIVGLVGIFMVSINYFIYKKILEKSKKKHAQEIISLSDEILNNK